MQNRIGNLTEPQIHDQTPDNPYRGIPSRHLQVDGRRRGHLFRPDLKAVADCYDPVAAPAPVGIGHPATDAPAYGWIGSFDYDSQEERLFATIGEIEPEFAELVKAGRFKKVSMAFFSPDQAHNPVAGSWYPRVASIGADARVIEKNEGGFLALSSVGVRGVRQSAASKVSGCARARIARRIRPCAIPPGIWRPWRHSDERPVTSWGAAALACLWPLFSGVGRVLVTQM
ncbi:hypothetical protein [Paracoccus sp. IB05]|uniref:hypothetical protein n=1 Tax=Paracoccus sp. IB05 TaxID=2779367 RepID=UPI0018E88E71|nr:hypothetical protein [Paracoccus sp. IB05]MBJ2153741.1 hypothetical protein [Paracoccus sp. IB05]